MQKFPLVALAAASLAAASLTYAQAANVPAGTKLAKVQHVNQVFFDDPRTLDPTATEESLGLELAHQLFEPLVTFNDKGELELGQAESYQVSEDGLTWTFKLRPDLKWSDGSKLTAQDFVTGWRRLVDPKNAFTYAFYLPDLAVKNAQAVVKGEVAPEELGVEALDDTTFVVHLDSPTPWFLAALVMPQTGPVPTKLFEAGKWPNKDNLVSNGAFTLKSFRVKERYDLVRNPNYWDNSHTVLDSATLQVVTVSTSALQRFQAGDVDATLVKADVLPQVRKAVEEKTAPWTLYVGPSPLVNYWGFNVKKAPFDNADVRKALTLALDTKEVAAKVLHGAVRATTVFTPQYPGFELQEAAYFNQDLETRRAEARKLLEKAGYSESHPLEFTVAYNTDDNFRRVAVAFQDYWKRTFGKAVQVKLYNSDWKSYLTDRQAGNFQFYRSGWGLDYADPASVFGIFTCGNPVNDQGYCNPEYDKTFRALYQAKSTEERRALYQKLNDFLTTDLPAVPVYNNLDSFAAKSNVKGVFPDDNKRRLKNYYVVEGTPEASTVVFGEKK